MHDIISGIVPPMVTPFDHDEQIDEDALRAETKYLIEDAQVHGLAVSGSTGEGHTLSVDEVRRVTAIVSEQANGRVPVITGIIADSTALAVEYGRAVSDLPVVALQVTPVHYLFRPDDNAMVRHFATIGERTGLPIMIYNVVPWTYLSPHLLTTIITEVDTVIGVKQSAGDLQLLANLLVQIEDRARIMSAVDALLYPSFTLGSHGAIAAILTAAPTLCVALWDAVRQDNHTTALNLHHQLLHIWNAINGDNLPANVKHCLNIQNRTGGSPRSPMPVTTSQQAKHIKQALQKAGLI